ncbi:hypothetical protein [Bradyrhizobium sp. JR3.5]
MTVEPSPISIIDAAEAQDQRNIRQVANAHIGVENRLIVETELTDTAGIVRATRTDIEIGARLQRDVAALGEETGPV